MPCCGRSGCPASAHTRLAGWNDHPGSYVDAAHGAKGRLPAADSGRAGAAQAEVAAGDQADCSGGVKADHALVLQAPPVRQAQVAVSLLAISTTWLVLSWPQGTLACCLPAGCGLPGSAGPRAAPAAAPRSAGVARPASSCECRLSQTPLTEAPSASAGAACKARWVAHLVRRTWGVVRVRWGRCWRAGHPSCCRRRSGRPGPVPVPAWCSWHMIYTLIGVLCRSHCCSRRGDAWCTCTAGLAASTGGRHTPGPVPAPPAPDRLKALLGSRVCADLSTRLRLQRLCRPPCQLCSLVCRLHSWQAPVPGLQLSSQIMQALRSGHRRWQPAGRVRQASLTGCT